MPVFPSPKIHLSSISGSANQFLCCAAHLTKSRSSLVKGQVTSHQVKRGLVKVQDHLIHKTKLFPPKHPKELIPVIDQRELFEGFSFSFASFVQRGVLLSRLNKRETELWTDTMLFLQLRSILPFWGFVKNRNLAVHMEPLQHTYARRTTQEPVVVLALVAYRPQAHTTKHQTGASR